MQLKDLMVFILMIYINLLNKKIKIINILLHHLQCIDKSFLHY